VRMDRGLAGRHLPWSCWQQALHILIAILLSGIYIERPFMVSILLCLLCVYLLPRDESCTHCRILLSLRSTRSPA
jgi:hypothetical protein